MSTFYLDYENGADVNDGSSWALAWKTITLGATAARIAPGDIIRIAKSPAPSSIGNATWNNLSKTVTLASAQTLDIDLCETAWTGAGDTTVSLNTERKEGSYAMKLLMDASPQASILQAYFATGEIDLSAYQKISFWIRNSGAVVTGNWIVNLCSDVSGVTVVDSFLIPAISSVNRWIPLTLTKEGGGNLGASIKSIAIYSGGTTTGMASKYLYVDSFIACTTAGLNLQSLISKNSAEQGGTEGWYGIQSIKGTTILLDNDTSSKAYQGRGYSGTTETVTIYKRETIKTDLATNTSTTVHEVKDSGTVGNNIQFQGGYNISTTVQDGETFFDGLNGYGRGIQLSLISFTTLNYLNFSRYYFGSYFEYSTKNTITTIRTNNNGYGLEFINKSDNNIIVDIVSANNNTQGIYFSTCNNNAITTISNVNNNNTAGLDISTSCGNNIATISNANNNASNGIEMGSSHNNTITTISNANNNGGYGVEFSVSSENVVKSLSTTGNSIGIMNDDGKNYIRNALIAEATEVGGHFDFTNSRLFSEKHERTEGNNRIFTDGGVIFSQATTRHTASGIAWDLQITSSNRASYYPLTLSIAKIAVSADNLVTVKAWFKKGHATNIGAKLVCKGSQIAGVDTDVTTTKADDTDWEELTITFTPTEEGVVEIEAWAYYVTGNSDVFVDDITITQA